jgi:hypothetical protein
MSCADDPGAAFADAEDSRISCSTARFRSRSSLKPPHIGSSDGIWVPRSHAPFAYSQKSSYGRTLVFIDTRRMG